MPNLERRIVEESVVRMRGKQFSLAPNQVVYYDPNKTSEFSTYIEGHYDEIKNWFQDLDYEFYYIPNLCSHFTTEQIQYLIPNWTNGVVQVVGNDLLKSWLYEKDRKIRAGFLRLDEGIKKTCKFFPLIPLDKKPWKEQMDLYRHLLLQSLNQCYELYDDQVRFSISTASEDNNLYSFFEKKLSLADGDFSEDEIGDEIKRLVKQLHKEGFEEFVLRCMVPVEEKLSRLVITSKYDVVLTDYGNKLIEISPLPKAVFLLFLKHPEGLYFKDLVDYKEELRNIYGKITNRVSSLVIGNSIERVVDPTENSINEKCSRINEAFLKQIDERLAKKYCITGYKSERKRITLPRNLVEWQCEL